MASKASLANQQVQENVHAQIKTFSMSMDEILIPDTKRIGDAHELPPQPIAAPPWSGLGFAIDRNGQPTDHLGMVIFAIRKLYPMLHFELEVAWVGHEMFRSFEFSCDPSFLYLK